MILQKRIFKGKVIRTDLVASGLIKREGDELEVLLDMIVRR